jgi:hypothetical protein
MRQVFHQEFPPKISYVGLFLDSEIIGYVQKTSNHDDAFIVATNMTTGIFVRCKIRMPFVSQLHISQCLSFEFMLSVFCSVLLVHATCMVDMSMLPQKEVDIVT